MTAISQDHDALRAVCEFADTPAERPVTGLCTITHIEGSFSRRLGAQLAVRPDLRLAGSLADGCLEQQLAREIAELGKGGGAPRKQMRFGAGSPLIDFRLPCGGGLDILMDASPDIAACEAALAKLEARQPASLQLPSATGLKTREYIPSLRLLLFGEGPELAAMEGLAKASGMEAESFSRDDGALSLGRAPQDLEPDPWTAIVLLFHDHEWEASLLDWGLKSPAFYIGAQGGAPARAQRTARLVELGHDTGAIGRISSPIGTVPHCREPAALALSVLAGIAGQYELLHPHHHA